MTKLNTETILKEVCLQFAKYKNEVIDLIKSDYDPEDLEDGFGDNIDTDVNRWCNPKKWKRESKYRMPIEHVSEGYYGFFLSCDCFCSEYPAFTHHSDISKDAQNRADNMAKRLTDIFKNNGEDKKFAPIVREYYSAKTEATSVILRVVTDHLDEKIIFWSAELD